MQNNPQNNSYNPDQKPSEAHNSSHWGNPPQTPISKHDPRYQSYVQQANGAPIPPPHSNEAYFTSAPNNTPITPPTNTAQQTPPPPQTPKRSKGVIVSIVIILFVAAMFGIGGCVACSTIDKLQKEPIHEGTNNALEEIHPLNPEEPKAGDQSTDQSENSDWANSDFRSYFLSEAGNQTITMSELDAIKNRYYNNQHVEHGHEYSDGVWFVGKDLPAGSYWLEGDEDDLSYFFILTPDDTSKNEGEKTYNVQLINNYYGHNIMDFKEGDVVVLDNDDDMIPLAEFNHKFKAPYESGVYRVGVDIPAGSYELSAGKAHDYYAYYIMKNLNYENSSYLEYETFMNLDGNQVTITLEDGEYLELYNMKAHSLSTNA